MSLVSQSGKTGREKGTGWGIWGSRESRESRREGRGSTREKSEAEGDDKRKQVKEEAVPEKKERLIPLALTYIYLCMSCLINKWRSTDCISRITRKKKQHTSVSLTEEYYTTPLPSCFLVGSCFTTPCFVSEDIPPSLVLLSRFFLSFCSSFLLHFNLNLNPFLYFWSECLSSETPALI